ncbi:MAG: hypothetical protein V3T83_13180 [Acidobacteriota bacterium]
MASGLKWLKGIGALVLLLALPTYSDLDFSGRHYAGEAELSIQQRATQGRNAKPELLRWHDAPPPSGDRGGREIPSALQLTQKARIGGGTATGVLPEELRRVPVGVPSSVASAGFVRLGRGQVFSPRPRNSVAEAAGLESLDAAESEAMGRMVGRANRARNLENPFLAALEERESGSADTQAPSDPAPTQLEETSQQQPPSEEGGEAADTSGVEAAPVEVLKERREDPPADDGNSPEAGENPDSNQDSGNDEAPPDDPPADEGNQDSNSDPTTPPSSQYNFLVIPQPDPLDEGRRVFLARRDEADEEIFLLDDGSSFFFPQSQVLAAVGLESNHQFATSDINFDGLLDLVRVRNESGYCALEVFLRDRLQPNGYEAIDVRLPERSVSSFALLDFDLDNLLDLAVLFEGASHLSIFRLDMQEKALRLMEERQLPFEPAVLIDWQVIHTGGWPERILFILDKSFQQAAATSSFDPGRIIQVSQIPPFRSLRVTWPSPAGPSETEVLVFESDDRITMLEAGRSGYRLYALFDTTFYSPTAVMGDFQGIGTRQLLALP